MPVIQAMMAILWSWVPLDPWAVVSRRSYTELHMVGAVNGFRFLNGKVKQ